MENSKENVHLDIWTYCKGLTLSLLVLQADVILVDIDGGHISLPDSVNLPSLPEPFLTRTRHELTLVRLEQH